MTIAIDSLALASCLATAAASYNKDTILRGVPPGPGNKNYFGGPASPFTRGGVGRRINVHP